MPKIHEGDVVRKLREERKWSRDKLAEESGVRANTVGDLERDGARNLQTLRCVAKALGFEVEDIFCKLKELRFPEQQHYKDSSDICCENHRDILRKLQDILHATNHPAGNVSDWIAGNIIMFHRGLKPIESSAGFSEKPQDDPSSEPDSGRVFTANGKELGLRRR